MKILRFLILWSVLCAIPAIASAQTPDTTRYIVYNYIKVAPSMEDDYLKLEKAFKKIHLARKKEGKLHGWGISRVLSPTGANCEYNYVARNTYLGNDQLANYFQGTYMPQNWQALLTKEELALVNRTDEIRTIVKEEVWIERNKAVDDDTKRWTIAVVNYFTSPEGKSASDHLKMENEIWKPVHAARVKDGNMSGWVLNQMRFPFGEDMPYHVMSVDLYDDMKQLLTPWFDTYFAKAHPGKKVDDLIKQTEAAERLLKGELRIKVEALDN